MNDIAEVLSDHPIEFNRSLGAEKSSSLHGRSPESSDSEDDSRPLVPTPSHDHRPPAARSLAYKLLQKDSFCSKSKVVDSYDVVEAFSQPFQKMFNLIIFNLKGL